MAENTDSKTNNDEATEAESKTFTQEQVDKIVKNRLARAKVPDDYEELRAKAAKLDELEEANKTEHQKVDKLKRELGELKAANKRREEVAAAAKEHGVDAELLERMNGDVTENAQFLAERANSTNSRKYPTTRDMGEKTKGANDSATARAARMLFGSPK